VWGSGTGTRRPGAGPPVPRWARGQAAVVAVPTSTPRCRTCPLRTRLMPARGSGRTPASSPLPRRPRCTGSRDARPAAGGRLRWGSSRDSDRERIILIVFMRWSSHRTMWVFQACERQTLTASCSRSRGCARTTPRSCGGLRRLSLPGVRLLSNAMRLLLPRSSVRLLRISCEASSASPPWGRRHMHRTCASDPRLVAASCWDVDAQVPVMPR